MVLINPFICLNLIFKRIFKENKTTLIIPLHEGGLIVSVKN